MVCASALFINELRTRPYYASQLCEEKNKTPDFRCEFVIQEGGHEILKSGHTHEYDYKLNTSYKVYSEQYFPIINT